MAPELAYDLLSRAGRGDPAHSRQRRLPDGARRFNPDGADHGRRLVPEDARHRVRGLGPALAVPQVRRATTTTATPSRPTWSSRSTWPRSCSATGCRRPTSITTTWAATARASTCRPTPSRSGRMADPLIWREISWYGAHMAYKEEEAGQSGVLNMAQYSGWGHFGFHWITPFHNIAGMLTESASAKLATPIFIHPDQLQGGARGLPAYEEQTTFPNPWPGGWWRLRDIVERQKISAWALLDLAARNRETVLWNAYLKAKRQTERGAAGQARRLRDPGRAARPADRREAGEQAAGARASRCSRPPQGVHRPQTACPTRPAPSWCRWRSPRWGSIRYLLGRTFYPDNEWTRDRDGTPIRPYDMATDTMFEFMGVRVDPRRRGAAGRICARSTAVRLAGQGGAGRRRLRLRRPAERQLQGGEPAARQGHRRAARRQGRRPGCAPGDFLVARRRAGRAR